MEEGADPALLAFNWHVPNRGLTYKFAVRFVSTDAELNAGQAVEPWSDTQLCWAIVDGKEDARTARTAALFVPMRVCFWRRDALFDRQQ